MLNQKAMLVYLSISQWTGRKLDRRATETVAKTHAASSAAGNYTKKLLPGARELERVNAHAHAMRRFFYEQTLPWFSDGARIISAKNYMEFTREFQKRKSELDAAVSEFLDVYPALQAHAQNALGDLYSPADYPSGVSLARKFTCEIDFMPLPDVGDFRTEISDSEREKFLSRMRDVETRAMRDAWSRLYDVIEKAAEKLKTPDAIFRNSLLDNVTELCSLLPRLNVTDDPQLEAKRLEVESLVAKMSPDVLRDNALERQNAAAKLNEIMNSMGAFMGAGKD